MLHYAIPRADAESGVYDSYWSATHTYVPSPDGRGFVLQNTQDITDLRRLKDDAFRPEAPPTTAMLGDSVLRRVEVLQSQSVQIRRLFMGAPGFVAILQGPRPRLRLRQRVLFAPGRSPGHCRPAADRRVARGSRAGLRAVARPGASARASRSSAAKFAVTLVRAPGRAPEQRFLDFIYQPIVEADGSISGVFVEGSDMTDRVVANQRQRLLMDELNHRVKNTLATVQAIAQQTLRGASTPETFAAAFEARLLALSKTHNALTDSQWAGAGLRQILVQELGPSRRRARDEMSGPVHPPAGARGAVAGHGVPRVGHQRGQVRGAVDGRPPDGWTGLWPMAATPCASNGARPAGRRRGNPTDAASARG
jgi:two-component sensor histidine kinase